MPHHFEIDMRKHGGNNGFKKLNTETGKEDIRKLEIPDSSQTGFAKVHEKYLAKKALKKYNKGNNG